MPIHQCNEGGKPGFKWGDRGKCYTYSPGNDASKKNAKKKAVKQAVAIGKGKYPEASDDPEILSLVSEIEAEDLLASNTNIPITMNVNLSYSEQIDFEENKDNPKSVKVKGVSCKAGYIENKQFIIPLSETENIAKTLKAGIDGMGGYILKDHGGSNIFSGPSLDSLIGRITNTGTKDGVVTYEGRIEDESVAHKIRTKLVSSSSVGLKVNNVHCSICGREYGDRDCMHILGKEYPEEGIHEMAKGYLEKPIAALVGKNIEAREQSIVLFPAIKGASVGMNFSEDTEKMLSDIEKIKEQKLSEKEKPKEEEKEDECAECDKPESECEDCEVIEKKGKNSASESDIIENNAQKDETFNKPSIQINGEQTMTDNADVTKLTGEITELKSSNLKLSEDLKTISAAKNDLETKVKNLSDEIATCKQVIDKYKMEEEARLKAEIDALVVKLSELRKTKGLPAKDYKNVSRDVLNAEFELLSSLPSTQNLGKIEEGNDEAKSLKLKEDIRETIFKQRKDGKPVTGMRKW